jgi:hypothetical protein
MLRNWLKDQRAEVGIVIVGISDARGCEAAPKPVCLPWWARRIVESSSHNVQRA